MSEYQMYWRNTGKHVIDLRNQEFVSLNIIQIDGMKKNARDKTLSEVHETRVKLALFWQYFCQIFAKIQAEVKLTNILQNFVKLLSTCYFWHFVVQYFVKILPTFWDKFKRQIVSKMLSNFHQFFIWIIVVDEFCQTFMSVQEKACKANCWLTTVLQKFLWISRNNRDCKTLVKCTKATFSHKYAMMHLCKYMEFFTSTTILNELISAKEMHAR